MNELLDDRLQFIDIKGWRMIYLDYFKIGKFGPCWAVTVFHTNRYGEPGPAAREVNTI